ncbi:hypothetical protein H632_c34p1 [Helicosporidium sp. ATCC 50920]|nr:hypothetical protein H632_c34p1 [Helicosporidium sp. ATCC 50920]|eukprot:KDD77037.1 hypothetical protein H632_c34p1 [Helicosporidium sp. ATCC 50920]
MGGTLESLAHTGDVTCLRAVPPSASGSHHTEVLLVGRGSTLFVFDGASGALLAHARCFRGDARVHGAVGCWRGSRLWIGIHGGREAAVVEFDAQTSRLQELAHNSRSPHWLMDMSWAEAADARDPVLVIGDSSDAVSQYSLDDGRLLALGSAQCSERSLLYSMSLHCEAGADAPPSVWVAGGTVFLQVLVWRCAGLSRGVAAGTPDASPPPAATCAPLFRLCGHQGSIHRVLWDHDGRRLASASDDRSLRVWALPGEMPSEEQQLSPALELYGHGARLWDIAFQAAKPPSLLADRHVVTVGEDCTVRFWNLETGGLSAKFPAHSGRGIWRCALLFGDASLVTGGADGAVHRWRLSDWIGAGGHAMDRAAASSEPFSSLKQLASAWMHSAASLSTLAEAPEAPKAQVDCTKDYVRCLVLASGNFVLVATNCGFVYAITLHADGSKTWSTVYESPRRSPIITLETLPLENGVATAAFCDHAGFATLLSCELNQGRDASPTVQQLEFRPYGISGPARGAFWCAALGRAHLFTTDLEGTLTLWRLRGLETPPTCEARFCSPFKRRVTAVAAQWMDNVRELRVVAGDQDGSLMAWSTAAVDAACHGSQATLLGKVKHAHHSAPVRRVAIAAAGTLVSAGGDGCLRHAALDAHLSCLRREAAPGIPTVEGDTHYFAPTPSSSRIVHGFHLKDYAFYCMSSGTNIARICCGGYRRPSAAWVEDANALTFVFVKSGVLWAYRRVASQAGASSARTLLPRHHGREINALKLVPCVASVEDACVISGGDDGEVRTWVWPEANGSAAVTGHTDGTMSLWDLVDVHESSPLPATMRLPEMHQSGVNALCAARCGCSAACDSAVLVSAGDDQSLRATWLRKSSRTATVVATSAIANAHGSAVRGVWSDGRVVFSVGLDQCLRLWLLNAPCSREAEMSSAPATPSPTQPALLVRGVGRILDVMEPATMDAMQSSDGSYVVAVGGIGEQLVKFLPS